MIALWMAYAVVLGALAALAALGLERLASLWRLPRRGIWLAAVAVSLLAPLGVRLLPAAPLPAPAALLDDGVAVGAATGLAVEPADAAAMAAMAAARLAEAASAAASGLAPLDRPLLLAWCAGSLLMLLALGRAVLLLRERRGGWERRTVDGTEVLVAPDLGPAALAGRAPAIVLPRWMLDMEAPRLRLVLRHELEHRAAGDPWLLMAGMAALVLAPWNVALWWQVGRLRLATEVDCDARVLRAHGSSPDVVERYGLLLLALGQRGGGLLLRLPVPALSEPVSTLERRIAAMTDRTPRHRWLHALALAAVASLAAAAACVTPSPNHVLGPTDGNLPQARVAPPPAAVDANQTYFEFQVEEPVAPLGNAQPAYPATLRSQGVTGRVIAQFVVGPDGTADVGTFKVLESDHELFSEAVREALPAMRFTPARVGGVAVKQLVQQPFQFGRRAGAPGDPAVARLAGDSAPAPSQRPDPRLVDANQTYFEFQVEEPVRPLRNVAPEYPAELRESGVKGTVIAQFVVNRDGTPDVRTFKVLASPDPRLADAVRSALPEMRFTPATVGGTAVRQLVQQPFVFGVP